MTDYQDKRLGGRIDNWCIDLGVMWGKIYDDDWWPDGEDFRTSRVIDVDLVRNIVETENSIYQLGPMAKGFNYEKWCKDKAELQKAIEHYKKTTGMFT